MASFSSGASASHASPKFNDTSRGPGLSSSSLEHKETAAEAAAQHFSEAAHEASEASDRENVEKDKADSLRSPEFGSEGGVTVLKHTSIGCAIVTFKNRSVAAHILHESIVHDRVMIGSVPVQIKAHFVKDHRVVQGNLFVGWGRKVELVTPVSLKDLLSFFQAKQEEIQRKTLEVVESGICQDSGALPSHFVSFEELVVEHIVSAGGSISLADLRGKLRQEGWWFDGNGRLNRYLQSKPEIFTTVGVQSHQIVKLASNEDEGFRGDCNSSENENDNEDTEMPVAQDLDLAMSSVHLHLPLKLEQWEEQPGSPPLSPPVLQVCSSSSFCTALLFDVAAALLFLPPRWGLTAPVRKKLLAPHAQRLRLRQGLRPMIMFQRGWDYLCMDGSDVVKQVDIAELLGKFRNSPISPSPSTGFLKNTLHRITLERSPMGNISSISMKFGRSVQQLSRQVQAVLSSNQSAVFLGPCSSGKTTCLRAAARFLMGKLHQHVVVVDFNRELAGGTEDLSIGGVLVDLPRRVVGTEQIEEIRRVIDEHTPQVIIVELSDVEVALKVAALCQEAQIRLLTSLRCSRKSLMHAFCNFKALSNEASASLVLDLIIELSSHTFDLVVTTAATEAAMQQSFSV